MQTVSSMERGKEMADTAEGRPLTGRKVLAITSGAFAVVIAVNVTLAVQAVRTFPGLEVANSYVASQSFEADRSAQQALGWTLSPGYAGGRLTLCFTDAGGRVVAPASLTAILGRTTEATDDVQPVFIMREGAYVAEVPLAPGKWMLMVQAKADDGTSFRQRIDLFVDR